MYNSSDSKTSFSMLTELNESLPVSANEPRSEYLSSVPRNKPTTGYNMYIVSSNESERSEDIENQNRSTDEDSMSDSSSTESATSVTLLECSDEELDCRLKFWSGLSNSFEKPNQVIQSSESGNKNLSDQDLKYVSSSNNETKDILLSKDFIVDDESKHLGTLSRFDDTTAADLFMGDDRTIPKICSQSKTSMLSDTEDRQTVITAVKQPNTAMFSDSDESSDSIISLAFSISNSENNKEDSNDDPLLMEVDEIEEERLDSDVQTDDEESEFETEENCDKRDDDERRNTSDVSDEEVVDNKLEADVSLTQNEDKDETSETGSAQYTQTNFLQKNTTPSSTEIMKSLREKLEKKFSAPEFKDSNVKIAYPSLTYLLDEYKSETKCKVSPSCHVTQVIRRLLKASTIKVQKTHTGNKTGSNRLGCQKGIYLTKQDKGKDTKSNALAAKMVLSPISNVLTNPSLKSTLDEMIESSMDDVVIATSVQGYHCEAVYCKHSTSNLNPEYHTVSTNKTGITPSTCWTNELNVVKKEHVSQSTTSNIASRNLGNQKTVSSELLGVKSIISPSTAIVVSNNSGIVSPVAPLVDDINNSKPSSTISHAVSEGKHKIHYSFAMIDATSSNKSKTSTTPATFMIVPSTRGENPTEKSGERKRVPYEMNNTLTLKEENQVKRILYDVNPPGTLNDENPTKKFRKRERILNAAERSVTSQRIKLKDRNEVLLGSEFGPEYKKNTVLTVEGEQTVVKPLAATNRIVRIVRNNVFTTPSYNHAVMSGNRQTNTHLGLTSILGKKMISSESSKSNPLCSNSFEASSSSAEITTRNTNVTDINKSSPNPSSTILVRPHIIMANKGTGIHTISTQFKSSIDNLNKPKVGRPIGSLYQEFKSSGSSSTFLVTTSATGPHNSGNVVYTIVSVAETSTCNTLSGPSVNTRSGNVVYKIVSVAGTSNNVSGPSLSTQGLNTVTVPSNYSEILKVEPTSSAGNLATNQQSLKHPSRQSPSSIGSKPLSFGKNHHQTLSKISSSSEMFMGNEPRELATVTSRSKEDVKTGEQYQPSIGTNTTISESCQTSTVCSIGRENVGKNRIYLSSTVTPSSSETIDISRACHQPIVIIPVVSTDNESSGLQSTKLPDVKLDHCDKESLLRTKSLILQEMRTLLTFGTINQITINQINTLNVLFRSVEDKLAEFTLSAEVERVKDKQRKLDTCVTSQNYPSKSDLPIDRRKEEPQSFPRIQGVPTKDSRSRDGCITWAVSNVPTTVSNLNRSFQSLCKQNLPPSRVVSSSSEFATTSGSSIKETNSVTRPISAPVVQETMFVKRLESGSQKKSNFAMSSCTSTSNVGSKMCITSKGLVTIPQQVSAVTAKETETACRQVSRRVFTDVGIAPLCSTDVVTSCGNLSSVLTTGNPNDNQDDRNRTKDILLSSDIDKVKHRHEEKLKTDETDGDECGLRIVSVFSLSDLPNETRLEREKEDKYYNYLFDQKVGRAGIRLSNDAKEDGLLRMPCYVVLGELDSKTSDCSVNCRRKAVKRLCKTFMDQESIKRLRFNREEELSIHSFNETGDETSKQQKSRSALTDKPNNLTNSDNRAGIVSDNLKTMTCSEKNERRNIREKKIGSLLCKQKGPNSKFRDDTNEVFHVPRWPSAENRKTINFLPKGEISPTASKSNTTPTNQCASDINEKRIASWSTKPKGPKLKFRDDPKTVIGYPCWPSAEHRKIIIVQPKGNISPSQLTPDSNPTIQCGPNKQGKTSKDTPAPSTDKTPSENFTMFKFKLDGKTVVIPKKHHDNNRPKAYIIDGQDNVNDVISHVTRQHVSGLNKVTSASSFAPFVGSSSSSLPLKAKTSLPINVDTTSYSCSSVQNINEPKISDCKKTTNQTRDIMVKSEPNDGPECCGPSPNKIQRLENTCNLPIHGDRESVSEKIMKLRDELKAREKALEEVRLKYRKDDKSLSLQDI